MRSLPEEKDSQDMDDTELSRWVKLSDKDREDARYDIKGARWPRRRSHRNPARRHSTTSETETDDHGMVIVGTAKDQEGNKYYKVKNSGTPTRFTTVIFMYPFPSSWRRPSGGHTQEMLSPAGIAARIKR